MIRSVLVHCVSRHRSASISEEHNKKVLPDSKVQFPEFRLEDPALFEAVKRPSDQVS